MKYDGPPHDDVVKTTLNVAKIDAVLDFARLERSEHTPERGFRDLEATAT